MTIDPLKFCVNKNYEQIDLLSFPYLVALFLGKFKFRYHFFLRKSPVCVNLLKSQIVHRLYFYRCSYKAYTILLKMVLLQNGGIMKNPMLNNNYCHVWYTVYLIALWTHRKLKAIFNCKKKVMPPYRQQVSNRLSSKNLKTINTIKKYTHWF